MKNEIKVPAIRGKFGNNDYYLLTIKAGYLVERAKIFQDTADWNKLEDDARWQREIRYNRVRSEITRYLRGNPDRFFGTIILALTNSKHFNCVDENGLFTFSGGENLITLDGQHRLKAMQFAITGLDQDGKYIGEPDSSLAQDEVSVIIIPTRDGKTQRRIFTDLNRNARQTTASENLVMDDRSIDAITARQVARQVIGKELVNRKGTTLSDNAGEFTTLSIIAECNKSILKVHFNKEFAQIDSEAFDGKNDRKEQKECKDVTLEVWRFLVKNINLFAEALKNDKGEIGDKERREKREKYLLGKPVPQWCLVEAFMQLTNPRNAKPLTKEEAVANLNKIKWSKSNTAWHGWLLTGENYGRIVTKNRRIAARIIEYMAGGRVDEDELLKDYLKLFTPDEQKNKKLPKRVV